jgi:hypothetical protein
MNAAQTTATTAGGAEAANRPCYLDVLQVFDTFELIVRSPTLDGSIPVRAAQGCKPLLDGNSAGLHVLARGPAMIQRQEDGPVLRLSDEGYAAATGDYEARLETLAARGILERDGYWHRELRRGFSFREGDTLRVWTGLLVKPDPGVWLLVTTAYNRRCAVEIATHVLCDASGFTPLVLEFDLTTLRQQDTWLDTEIATLTALRPGTRLSIRSLAEDPAPGQTFLDFYTADYLDRRGEAKYAGRYRQVTARQDKDGDGVPEWRIVYGGGARQTIEIGRFDCFLTRRGPAAADPSGAELEYGLVRSLYDVEGRWDGSNLRDLTSPPDDAMERLTAEWSALYGAESFARAEWWASYVLPLLGPHRAEPFMSQSPWLFTVTPPGWSAISDALPFPNLDPMRGVISTDTFPAVPVAHQIQSLGGFQIREGAAAGRIVPIPRELLQPGFRTESL